MNLRRDQEFFKQVGANLQQIRESIGLSQEELANKAEIQRSQVARIERGETNPTLATVKVIADVLEIDIKMLFEFN